MPKLRFIKHLTLCCCEGLQMTLSKGDSCPVMCLARPHPISLQPQEQRLMFAK
jgi:hypothetical protein